MQVIAVSRDYEQEFNAARHDTGVSCRIPNRDSHYGELARNNVLRRC